MKRRVVAAWIVIAGASLGAACDDSNGGPPELTAEQREDPVLVTGEGVFADQCATCHGADGHGSGSAPSLAAVEDRYSLEEQAALIEVGRGGMPPFSERLSDDEIEAVARYEREVL